MLFQKNNQHQVLPTTPKAGFEFAHAFKPYYVQTNNRVKPSSDREVHIILQKGIWNGITVEKSQDLDDNGIWITHQQPHDRTRHFQEPYPYLRVYQSYSINHQWYKRNKVLLLNECGQACAVILKKAECEENYKLYGFQPYTLGQQPSRLHDKDKRPLYKWGTLVSHRVWNATRSFSLVMVNGVRYHAEKVQGPNTLLGQNVPGFQSKTNPYEYTVTVTTPSSSIQAETCATFRENKKHGWDISLARGLDTNLMIAFAMMLDDFILDHQQEHSRILYRYGV